MLCAISALRASAPTAEATPHPHPPALFSLYRVTYEHAYENYQRQQHHIWYYAIDGTMKQCQFFIKAFFVELIEQLKLFGFWVSQQPDGLQHCDF